MVEVDFTDLREGRHQLSMQRLHCVRVEAPAGLVVRCVSGEVWLTHSGSADDLFLGVGAGYECAHAEALYIDSLRESSTIEVSRAPAKVLALPVRRAATGAATRVA